ncbi:hypothetical protein HUT18_19940 [Streptomyces sp. NA04227]|uniref:hypothetical protein n=1 Tax=Streptomyces sp. NA04227 TaxID=2742136 RepID=UPI00159117A3|nr:hypothetical protein [Streptomyces sp. NA04227]QKW08304.1 hypothetical protein HUT18_19940 [Streptomyces sp. NA04227]
MTSASIASVSAAPYPARRTGCTADPAAARPRRKGGALHAVKVFTGTAFGVLVLGDHAKYAEEAGVRLR